MYNAAMQLDTTSQNVAEEYLVDKNGALRSLLPGEEYQMDGMRLKLLRKTRVEGVAGTGGIELKGNLLGGWCSFGCQLEVPRRFAVREAKKLASGIHTERILNDVLRKVLTDVFVGVQQQVYPGVPQMKKQLGRLIRAATERELMMIGWQVTYCKLEDIQITRREEA